MKTTLILRDVLQGQSIDSFKVTVTNDGVDLTGYQAIVEFRRSADEAQPSLVYKTADNTISISNDVELIFEERNELALKCGEYTGDLFLIAPSGKATPLCRMKQKVLPSYTKLT